MNWFKWCNLKWIWITKCFYFIAFHSMWMLCFIFCFWDDTCKDKKPQLINHQMSACFLSIFVSRGLSSNLVRRNSILKYPFKTYINIMKLCNFPRTVNLFMYAAFAVGSPHCGAVVVLRTRPLANVKARLSASPNPVMRDNSCPDKVSLVEVTGCVAVQVCFTLDFDFKNDNWTPCMFFFSC